MIKKERLKELIEQGATVYSLDTKLYGCVKWLELENKLEKLEFNEDKEVKLFITDNGWWHWFSLKDLYENKEDVEEILEFGNITRTERLELPSWDKIKQESDCCIEFFSKNNIRCWLALDMPYKNDIGIISVAHSMNEMSVENIFVERFTRENYNEARRLCVKLFKGENDG